MPAQAEQQIDVEILVPDETLRGNIAAFLSIYQYRDRDDLSAPAVRRLHEKAPQEIRRALQPYGYYSPDITSRLQHTAGGWHASYQVAPGPAVIINHYSLSIAPGIPPDAVTEQGRSNAIRELRSLLLPMPFRQGQRLEHARYSSYKDRVLKTALSLGFLDARFETARLEVDTDRLQADIRLRLALGPRYRFGEVTIEQDILNDDFMQRFVEFEQGEPFDYDKLLNLQYSLIDSNYFSNVSVEPHREQAVEHIVPITIRATANERTRYRVGFGYGTDTGGRVTFGMQRRYVNRRGHWLDAEAQFAEVRNTATVAYNIPLGRPGSEYFRIAAKSQFEELADTESRINELSLSRVRSLGRWQQTLYTVLRKEDSFLPEGEFESKTVVPGASWLTNRMNNPLYPTEGYKLYGDIHGSHPALGSDETYLQVRVQGRRAWPVSERLRFFSRLDIGYTAIDEEEELPVSERFFAGGDQSVRGFDYNRLAPVDAEGNIVGGKYLLVGSVQLDYRITQNWGVSTFYDAGNAMESLDEELEAAYGIGAIWFSPVGPVRLSVARPVNEDRVPKSGYEIHFNFGPDL